jgi:hypothetical protein
MTIRFDDKGKFFTEVVSKEVVPVIIQTITHRIHGKIHIRPGERLKDEINQAEPFVAVTEAEICDGLDRIIFQADFMVVYREQIVWMIPRDQLTHRSEPLDGGEA